MPLTQETKVQSALDDVASNFPRSARPCRAAGFDATFECDPEETGETALETTQRIIERGEACEFMPMRCALTGGVAGQVGLALCTERFFQSFIKQTNCGYLRLQVEDVSGTTIGTAPWRLQLRRLESCYGHLDTGAAAEPWCLLVHAEASLPLPHVQSAC